MESLSGRKFVRFASRLIYYQGAVVAKMQRDYGPEAENDETPQSTSNSSKMSMSDAMKKYTPDNLDALNRESESAMGGTLFERVSVPAK